jgi:alkanesulfonate monooxygenase SsuD/methylene tetrahydromethanopterin reductase-like flavin-dependent oxidoreductase (luciferase family)
MTVKIGYLLPTREQVMLGDHAGHKLLDAARRAADLGFDSVWAGDSLLARPRHDPLTLLAAVTGALPHLQIGTAVLLPVLRNPVVLAQQLATLDQLSNGQLIVGAGIAADAPPIRHEFAAAGVEFEGRVGRMMEAFRLMRALWSGEPVDWHGRWEMQQAMLAPTPATPGGPPIWIGTGAEAGIARAAKHFDGWFPIGPDVETFGQRRASFLAAAEAAGRAPHALHTALYLTLAVDADRQRADTSINTYLENYYSVPAAFMRKIQACFGGPLEDVLAFVRGYVDAGAQHLVIRVVGDHGLVLEQLAQNRDQLNA